MTLNVNLEDVPWAILEVVKARIMANRKKLEEAQEQSLEAQLAASAERPQYRSIGASTRRRVDPEPGAVYVVSKGVESQEIIIWFPTTAPALGHRVPAAADVDGRFRNISDIVPPGSELNSLYLTDEVNGSNVWFTEGNPPGSNSTNLTWEFEVPAFGIGSGDFTLEFYANIPGSTRDESRGDVVAYILADQDGAFTFPGDALSLRQARFGRIEDGGERFLIDSFEAFDGAYREYALSQSGSAVSGSEYFHASLQRINGVLYTHFRGELVDEMTADDWNGATVNYGTDRLLLVIALVNANGNPVYSGQVRATNRARYGAAPYTPPTDPFYDPTP